MPRLRVDSYRWVDDEPQPGIVEVGFTDANGKGHLVIDKHPVFSALLDEREVRPTDLAIMCAIMNDDPDSASVRVEFDWYVETTEGLTTVLVFRDQFVPDPPDSAG